MTFPGTGYQSNREPLGCEKHQDSNHECAETTDYIEDAMINVNMNQDIKECFQYFVKPVPQNENIGEGLSKYNGVNICYHHFTMQLQCFIVGE